MPEGLGQSWAGVGLAEVGGRAHQVLGEDGQWIQAPCSAKDPDGRWGQWPVARL